MDIIDVASEWQNEEGDGEEKGDGDDVDEVASDEGEADDLAVEAAQRVELLFFTHVGTGPAEISHTSSSSRASLAAAGLAGLMKETMLLGRRGLDGA